MSELDVALNRVNTLADFVSKPDHDKKSEQKLINEAHQAIKIANNTLKETEHKLTDKEICAISSILYKLNTINATIKKTSDENGKILNTIQQIMFSTLELVSPGKQKEDIALAGYVFNEMLDSIRSDAHEEIVGQERPPQAIPRMIAQKMVGPRADIKIRQAAQAKITKVGADLYPVALLAASLDPNARIPSRENEEASLKKDARQFEKELISQFGKGSSKWTSEEFTNCLKRIWDIKRNMETGNEQKQIKESIKDKERQFQKY